MPWNPIEHLSETLWLNTIGSGLRPTACTELTKTPILLSCHEKAKVIVVVATYVGSGAAILHFLEFYNFIAKLQPLLHYMYMRSAGGGVSTPNKCFFAPYETVHTWYQQAWMIRLQVDRCDCTQEGLRSLRPHSEVVWAADGRILLARSLSQRQTGFLCMDDTQKTLSDSYLDHRLQTTVWSLQTKMKYVFICI